MMMVIVVMILESVDFFKILSKDILNPLFLSKEKVFKVLPEIAYLSPIEEINQVFFLKILEALWKEALLAQKYYIISTAKRCSNS